MSVKIIYNRSKDCFHLRVNGKFIGFIPVGDNYSVCAINASYPNCAPYGTANFISIQAIRELWANQMPFIIAQTQKPYNSVWGNLIAA